MEAFYERSFAFNEQLNTLGLSYDDYVRSVTFNGKHIEGLNEIVRIDSLNPENGTVMGDLHYFTPARIPENLRSDIADIYVSLFCEQ
ncbi:hypothetical protein [Mucilaginibacter flavidus]|uniref:hypothetical protein n=1 Tax=Mucilaginibacter flavidus TaxID=2949309 RepID=UPI0020933600|nr:hypothetical protein [Mucilaginibacter flavidus]MCO5946725.1 hypothetical protein [Mucilaginibacter flavidus]